MGDDGVKKKPGGGKNDSSGSASGETSGLRRSTRSQSTASPGGSVRKSQRLENRTPEVVSPVRRSLREGKVQASGKGTTTSPLSSKSGKVQSKGGVRVPEGSTKEKSLKEIVPREEESVKRDESVKESCEDEESVEMKDVADDHKDVEIPSPKLRPNVDEKRPKRYHAKRFLAMYELRVIGQSEPQPKKRRLDDSGYNVDSSEGVVGDSSRENCEKDVDSALRNPEGQEYCKEVVDKDVEEPNEKQQGCSAEEDMKGISLKNVNDGTDDLSSVLEENICVEKSSEPLTCTLEAGKNTGDCVSMKVNGFVAGKRPSQDIHMEPDKLSDGDKSLRCTQNASTPEGSAVGGEGTVADIDIAPPVASNRENSCLIEDCTNCSKKRRIDYDSSKQELCSCLSHAANISGLVSIYKDRGKCLSTTGEDGRRRINSDPSIDGPQKTCISSERAGELMYCAGKGCGRSYHPSSLCAREEDAYISIWYCSECMKKKLALGVQAVSQGIESILDVREVESSDSEGAQKEKRYFVKYKGLAHIHNQWVGEMLLHHEAPELLLKLKEQDSHWNPEWAVPHRLLLKRPVFMEKADAGLTLNSQHEWLVKWRCLDYDQASWELEDSECLKTPEAMQLVKEYETRHNGARSHLSGDDKFQDKTKSSHVKHGRLSDPPRLESSFLNSVNKLREYHQKSHNAVLLDEQDRAVKVTYFISTILSNVRRPFLIIAPRAYLSYWETEFLRSTEFTNVVVYDGNSVSRKLIRSLEFSDEGGQLMLQVLLSCVEAVSEDMEHLRGISWEAVVVDDCQEPCILRRSVCIKSLNTNWMLLLLNAQLTDAAAEYINILSLLETGGDSSQYHNLQDDSIEDISILKERLSSFIICARFQEYWVPVELSNIQLEQYCSFILSNSTVFSSCSKSDPVDSLRNILISTQKCCNHPYIDVSLRKLLPDGFTNDAVVDLEIKASGKLQLLDKILSEFRTQAMKVLIIFQSSAGFGPENVTLGVILEDFLQCRFGEDSYEHVAVGGQPSKKQSAVSRFNKERERSFLLLEKTRACLPSIKLLTVDAVIIYNSDWNPLNDLKALQKITIDSKLKPIQVFRLYCTCTVEERSLIFAKNDTILDSTMQVINPSTKQILLMWGSLYLFSRLDEFHGDKVPLTIDNVAFRTSFLTDVCQEIVSCNRNLGNNNLSKYVSLARQDGRSYLKCTFLYGEQRTQIEDGVPSHSFWVKLLEGKQPQWKYLFGLTERNRKRVNYSDKLPLQVDVYTDELAKKRKDSSPRRVRQNPEKLNDRNKEQPGSKANNSPNYKAIGQTLFMMTDSNRGPADMNSIEQDERRNLQDQRGLLKVLKPSVSRLCEMLLLEEEEKRLAEKFLEYVLNNHRVTREPETILQALQISVCWTAAAVRKKKIDYKRSLGVARELMNFKCTEDEANFIHTKMKLLMKVFLSRLGDLNVPNSTVGPAAAADSIMKDAEENCTNLHVTTLGNRDLGLEERSSAADISNEVCALLRKVDKEKDNPGCIDKVQRRCEKDMERLKDKQNEELVEFEKCWDKKRVELEKTYKLEAAVIRYSHVNTTVGIDKLKNLANDYAKKKEDLESQMSCCRKELEARQQEETDEELKKIARLLELVNPMANDKLLEIPPSMSSLHLKSAKHIGSREDLGATVSISGNLPEEEASGTPQPVVPTNNQSRLPDEQRAGSENVNSTQPVDRGFSPGSATEAVPDGCLKKRTEEDSCASTENRTSEVDSALEDRLTPLPSNLDNAASITVCCVSMDPSPSTVSAVIASASQVDGVEEQIQHVTENPNASAGCEMVQLDLANPVHSDLPLDARTRVSATTQHSILESIVHSCCIDQTRVSSSGQLCNHPNEVQNTSAQMQHMPNFEVNGAIETGVNHVSRGAFTARSSHVPMINTTISRLSDPLQNECERIRKEIGEIVTSHEETKLRLKSECEKEIEELVAQIRRKYNAKIEEAESSFLLKKNELEMNQNMVMMNKFLADAFRSKCMDYKAGPQVGLQKGMASGSAELPRQLLAPIARPRTAASAVSVVPNAASPHGTTPARAVHPYTTVSSGVSSRSLHINPLGSSIGFQRGRDDMRAAAPDLQPRSNKSGLVTSSALEVQPPNNHRAYFVSPQVPTRPPEQLPDQSNRATMGSSRPLNHSLSATELLTEIARQNDSNLRQLAENLPPLPFNLQNHETWDLSQFGSTADVPCPPSNVGAGDVVCLSDDE